MLACAAHSDNVAHRGDFQTILEPKDLAHLGRAGVGQNRAIDINRRDDTIPTVPAFDTQGSLFVLVDINLGIGDVLLVQEPLGDTAVASPRGGIDRHRCSHTVSFTWWHIASCLLPDQAGLMPHYNHSEHGFHHYAQP